MDTRIAPQAQLPQLPDTDALLDAVAGHLSPRTRTEYLRDLRLFLSWYAPTAGLMEALRQFCSMDSLSAHAVVAQYRAHLRERGQKPTSINRKLSAIKAVLNALWARGLLRWRLELRGEPIRTTHAQRVAQKLPAHTPAGLRQVLSTVAAPQGADAEALRDALAGALMALAGLRRVELQRLTWGNLHGEALTVHGKGGKVRTVLLAPQVLGLWSAYKSALDKAQISTAPEAPVFVILGKHAPKAQIGRPLSLPAINAIANKLLGRAGAKRKGISCHALRHTFATLAATQGAQLTDLAQTLGHSSIATTGLYAHVLSAANISALVAQGLAPTPAPAPNPVAAKPRKVIPAGKLIKRI